MKGLSPDQNQPSLLHPMLRDQLNPKHPLFLLSEKMPWRNIEKELSQFYSNTGVDSSQQEWLYLIKYNRPSGNVNTAFDIKNNKCCCWWCVLYVLKGGVERL